MISLVELERQLFDLTQNEYGCFLESALSIDDSRFRLYLQIEEKKENIEEINRYALMSLKVLSVMEIELNCPFLFDQHYDFVPRKSPSVEGNLFCTFGEIFTIANQLKYKPKAQQCIIQIFMRTRALSIMNVWDSSINFDMMEEPYYTEPSFLEDCKRYFLGNKRYLRYTRLLQSALGSARHHEISPKNLPFTMKNYKDFLKNPFVFVVLKSCEFTPF